MLKYKGFPSRMSGSNYQFKIRRANPKGATKLIERERYKDRKFADKNADKAFLVELLHYFGEDSFERGCLDAGRLSWLLGREVVTASETFDPFSYTALLRLDLGRIRISFPEILK
tara:strand:+ start:135 stop:479 length:345 start_codon:yes stop_codon:yes gene_type:complete